MYLTYVAIHCPYTGIVLRFEAMQLNDKCFSKMVPERRDIGEYQIYGSQPKTKMLCSTLYMCTSQQNVYL